VKPDGVGDCLFEDCAVECGVVVGVQVIGAMVYRVKRIVSEASPTLDEPLLTCGLVGALEYSS
jgi:hypothetical protein